MARNASPATPKQSKLKWRYIVLGTFVLFSLYVLVAESKTKAHYVHVAADAPVISSSIPPATRLISDSTVKTPCDRDLLILQSVNTTKILSEPNTIFSSEAKCSVAGYTSGEWVFDPDISSIKQVTGLDMDMGVASSRYRTKDIKAGTDVAAGDYRGNKWVWEPSNTKDKKCVLEPFDTARWCAAVGYGKSVLLVGDSLSAEMTTELRRQLSPGSKVMNGCGGHVNMTQAVYDSTWGKEHHQTVVCPGGGKVTLSISHHLTIEDSSKGPCKDLCYPTKNWAEIVQDYDILVLNTGIHMMDLPGYKSNLEKAGKFLRDKYKGKVFWRDSTAGNPKCDTYSRPIKSADFKPLGPQETHYGWNKVARMNEIAVEELSKYVPGFVHLKTDPMTKLRADAHKGPTDCVHFQRPNAPDYWVLLLYNYIIENIKD